MRAFDGKNISAKGSSNSRFGFLSLVNSHPLTDYFLIFATTVLLLGVGAVMVLSSSSVYGQAISVGPYYFAIRQVIFILVGLPLALWISRLKINSLKNLSWLAMVIVLGLLVVTLLFGSDRKGNQAWIDLGFITLQPSEFSKPAVVLWAASIWSNRERRLHEVRALLMPTLIGFVLILLLVALQNDLGTALIIAANLFALLYFAGTSWKVLFSLIGATAVGVAAMVLQSPNRMMRIFSFLGHEAGAGASDQPQSAVFALATGGWFGVGIGASRQKWGSLYDGVHNDYVLAVIGEELGLAGVMVLVAMLAVIGFVGFRIAARSNSLFYRVVASGITSWTMLQALVNIFVVMKMLPVIGVPLPFVSYGGSALLANLIGIGLLLNCARNEPAAKRQLANKTKTRKGRHSVSAVVDATR